MRAWILSLIAAAVLAAVLWLVVDPSAGERKADEPVASAGEGSAPGAPAQLAAPGAPAAGGAAGAPGSTQPGATPQAGGASAVHAAPATGAPSTAPNVPPSRAALWEQRYSGQTSAQLMAHVRELHQSVEVEAAAYFEQERDAGRYHALPIVRDAQGRPSNPLLALGTTDAIRHVFVVDERDEWQVVELSREQHPELYALWDEKLWLVQRVNELEFVQED